MIEVGHEGIAPAPQVIGVLFGLMDQVERHRQPSQGLTTGEAGDASGWWYSPRYGSWDDDIPNMMGKRKMFQTTNQFSMLKKRYLIRFLGET